ncbi:hypothetical protein J2S92_003249 [Arthrobacter bambusae]|nr:hypothetical protein [Arthrobacter bambusae]MDQ0236941.1 hypothetical protein [Arthrobacter bambusae]
MTASLARVSDRFVSENTAQFLDLHNARMCAKKVLPCRAGSAVFSHLYEHGVNEFAYQVVNKNLWASEAVNMAQNLTCLGRVS